MPCGILNLIRLKRKKHNVPAKSMPQIVGGTKAKYGLIAIGSIKVMMFL